MSITITITGDTIEECIERARAYNSPIAKAVTTAVAATTEKSPSEKPVKESRDEEQDVSPAVDADGFPYNSELHTSTRAVTKDGLWKAARGKAVEEKQARQEWKSAGGNIEAPVIDQEQDEQDEQPAIEQERDQSSPELPGEDDSPELPGEDQSEARSVTIQELHGKLIKVMSDIGKDELLDVYEQFTGERSSKGAAAVLVADAELRVKVYDHVVDMLEQAE